MWNRRIGLAGAALAVLATALGAGGSARAQIMTVIEPSSVFVDKGSLVDERPFLFSGVDSFSLWSQPPMGDFIDVTVLDFEIPSTAVIFGENFSFLVEGAPASDVQLLWNVVTGDVVSETFRVQMDFNDLSGQKTSFFDLTLSSDGAPSIECPGSNTHPAIAGIPLPAGGLPPGGGTLRLAASACAVDEVGVTNELPFHVVALELTADVPQEIQGDIDSDGDGLLNAADNCPTVPNPGQENADGDTHGDLCDNCTLIDNENQLDCAPWDGYGSACDADLDDDGFIGAEDFVIFKLAFGAHAGQPGFVPCADFDGNGGIGATDYVLLKERFGSGPLGPSGLACAGPGATDCTTP